MGRRTCSYECEKAALHACIRKLKDRYDRGGQLPEVVIFCDCRSLVQNLIGVNPTSMGDILSAMEQLRQADVRIICQWIPSHITTVMRLPMSWLTLADYSLKSQSRQPWLMSRPYYVRKRRKGEKRRSEGLAKLYEARRADDYCSHLPRGDAVQVFHIRVNHVLLLASMSKRGWGQSASCRL